ncbi:CDP-glycerol glycerophosphotransferase family protein [Murimonas intestini]|uniref:CDP-glycerol:poly(Glycerophosphate) glycerophosphotransferase n=1 Tax=Murimonas intestini TaxID=1337051 RepID=A0AB73T559_9FIRM|nr:CDP-glycerol glycerophosphotransferase family protein [Murimonas intestini]MCR1840676.1 CDP-glycerol glycerophosphotransferase family protein [Murimonas intestini]MCR1865271.1 CDP-glycerol glycerophosphotransferase family protein [Murimonas intestini]MCR1883035.1 CDP-glycerol glycerophosphotransferase family protein [Murimonas intestini]
MELYALREELKYIVKHIMRFGLKAYWLAPMKEKRILFMANMGKGYLCNPKYIYESMLDDERFAGYEFIWCFNNPEDYGFIAQKPNTKVICKKDHVEFFKYLLTSGIVVYNCGGFSYAPIRKKQFLIETGHGGGLQKRNGFLQEGKSKASNKGITLASKDIKLWISSSKLQSEMYTRQAMAYRGEILDSGYPRTDLFFKATSEQKERIRKNLGVGANEKIILYAPTFKGDEGHAVALSKSVEVIDVYLVKDTLKKRFGGDWVFAKRGHQYSQQVDIDTADYDWTKYPDMQEILLVADILITDYSSCLWDFAIMHKPCFLFVPDLKTYMNKDRGFYIPIEKWAGIMVYENSEWKEKIESFESTQYNAVVDEYLMMMGSYENGNATETVKTRILRR